MIGVDVEMRYKTQLLVIAGCQNVVSLQMCQQARTCTLPETPHSDKNLEVIQSKMETLPISNHGVHTMFV